MKFFDSRTFLIYRSVPQRNFLALWEKNFSTECHDIPFFYISFFRCLTFETVWNIRWFPTKFFATVRQKNWRKNVTCKEVSEIPNFLNLRSRSQEIFAYCETKNFEWRTWFSVLMHRKIRYPKISGRSKVLRTKFFSTVRPKKIKGESRYPAPEHKSLRCPKDSETKRDSLPSFVGSIREKNSTEKSDITLLGMKFFDSRTFLIYQSVPQRNFSALWAKKFSAENRDIPFSFKIFFVTSHLKLFET